jgi:hypothetical protein
VSILKRFQEKESGRRAAKIEPFSLTLEDHKMTGTDEQLKKEHLLYATAMCRFWCNDAELHHARETAKRIILHEFYGDITPHLDLAISSIYGGDIQSAGEHLLEIRNIVDGREP